MNNMDIEAKEILRKCSDESINYLDDLIKQNHLSEQSLDSIKSWLTEEMSNSIETPVLKAASIRTSGSDAAQVSSSIVQALVFVGFSIEMAKMIVDAVTPGATSVNIIPAQTPQNIMMEAATVAAISLAASIIHYRNRALKAEAELRSINNPPSNVVSHPKNRRLTFSLESIAKRIR
jgi:hypothetical protein